ncbi:putative ribonuclease H-like domain-containing protein [Tanacetum coccineum]
MGFKEGKLTRPYSSKGTKMSSMGELTFFLGLEVQQKKDGIFISQDKYVEEILKKFGFTEVKTASTPMETQKPLLKDENGKEVDVHMYRYLKGQPKLGLWYPKDSPFDLVAYSDSDYARASLDKKSTTGGKAKKSVRLVMEKFLGMELELMIVPQPGGPTYIVADEAVHKELSDSLVRVATTDSSLEAEQDNGNITKTQSKATPNEAGSKGTTLGDGLRRQETIGDNIAQTRRVESSGDEDSLGEDVSKQGMRINAIDVDEDITLVNVQDDAEMFDVNTLIGDEVFAEQEVAAKDVNLTIDEVTLAHALTAMKSVKPKDKGKGIMVEEPVKTMKNKDLIKLDEETAKRLQAEFDENKRLAREKDEANVALIEEWDDIQAKIEADHELAQRLQAEEQEELFVEEKAKLYQQLLKQRRKHFAGKSAKKKRNKPPTQGQQIKIMCTYLKNIEGKKPKDLKNKSFNSLQKMFDRAFKRQKVDEDKDTTELQSLIEVIPNEEEVAIDVVPLATKPPTIVDWKIHKEGKKSYYQIVRADGKSQMYKVFSLMLKSFSREDLEDLYKLVKAKYKSTRPVEDLDLVLWSDLKTMFEPHGRIVGIKCLLNAVSITAALIDVNAAQSKLVLLENFNENYSKCLRLLYKSYYCWCKVTSAEGVNAASEEVSTAELKKKKPNDEDRDEDPPAGPDRGLKRRKTCKDVEPSKRFKSTGSSKEEIVYEAQATKTPQNQGDDMGTTNEQPNVKASSKNDLFKKPKRAPSPNLEWNEGKSVDNEPAQNWLCDLAKVGKPHLTFNELMITPIDFPAFAMNRLPDY